MIMPKRKVTNALSAIGLVSNGLKKMLENSDKLKHIYVEPQEKLLMPRMLALDFFYMPKGVAKFYVHDEDNNRNTLQILGDNSFIFTDEFFLGDINPDVHIVMLESAELFKLSFDDMNEILKTFPEARGLIDFIRQDFGRKNKRRLAMLHKDAMDRLPVFARDFKELYGRLSVKEICLYLNICEKTYKRSRAKMLFNR